MAHENQLRNPKYRNWVKSGLGLKYLKEGLEQFTVDVMDEQHQAILMAVKKSSKSTTINCCQCQVNTLLPNHARTKSNHCPLGVNDCNCRQPRGKLTCPNDICGAIYEQIIYLHGSTPPTPYWRNTDATLWCSNPWEIAKCFINAPGYAHTRSASDTDCAGFLHIIVNNKGFHSHLQCYITGSDIFCKTRQYRNEILHSAMMELDNETADKYIEDMIAVLQDPKELCTRPESVEAVKKLTELKEKNFTISTENEMEIREMRKTLAKETDESLEKIKTTTSEHIDQLEGKYRDVDSAIQRTKADTLDIIQTFHNDLLKEHTISLGKKVTKYLENIESSVSKQENRITQSTKTAESDLAFSRNEAIKEMKTVQSGLLSKHMDALDKKVEEINQALSQKQISIVKSLEETGTKQKQILKPMSKGDTDSREQGEITASALPFNEKQISREEAMECTVQGFVKKQPDYKTIKQDFKKRLIGLYMDTVVKVSAWPLHPEQNEATIHDLYVTPWLKPEDSRCHVVKTQTSPEFATGNERSMNITSFYDIFYKDGKLMKLIYIIGEAGSGKSAFCKNMIHKWCSYNSEQSEICLNTSQRKHFAIDEVLSDEEIMKSFEFLFYISLRHNADSGDIRTMLNNHYEDTALDVILERESGNCLILIDGLDEWKPPAEEKLSQFQTTGLPKRDLNKQYTVITTSRPWKVEVLKIKESEIDTKIRLCGIEYKSIITMATYTVTHLNKMFNKKKSANRFLAKYVLSNEQNKTPLRDFMKSPVMLQQLVCLWYDDKLHQSSRCNIYISMLELSLEWSAQRKPDDRIFEMFREKSVDLGEVSLPPAFDDDSICEEYKYIVVIAGKVAYHTLFSEQKESSLTFSQGTLRKYGASKDLIQCCLDMGIFTEEKNVTFSVSRRRNTQFSFTHKSIQEVLAAIYIVMQCETHKVNSKTNEPSQDVLTYFRNVKTAEDILEQSNVIELICGLNPPLAEDVSRYIFEIVTRDERFVEFRTTLKDWHGYNIIVQIQELVFGCIKEFHSNENYEGYELRLADIVIRNKADIPLLRNIKSDSIMSITISGEIWGLSRSSIHLSDGDVCILCSIIDPCSSSLRRFCKIDSITADAIEELPIYSGLVSSKYKYIETLELRDIRLPHDNMFGLSSFLKQNTNLQVLTLRHIHCEIDQCNVHDANLSEHVKLRGIDIRDCDVRLIGLNTENLERFILIWMDMYSSIDNLLSGAPVLEHLQLSSWTFYSDSQKFISDMQKLKYIEVSDVHMSETTWHVFTNSLKTFPCLQKLCLVAINIPDSVKLNFLNDIQEVSQIQRLYLKNLKISLQFPKCFKHLKHLAVDNVKSFETDMCEFASSLKYVCGLEYLVLGNMDIQSSSFTLPPSLVCLKHIMLQNVKLKEARLDFGLSLHHLQQLEIVEFRSLNIPDAFLRFSREMQNLRIVSFEKVLMSLDSWKDIADSLSLLPQSIEVQTVDLYIENGSLEAAIEYVKRKKDLFQVSLRFGVDCSFKTIKSSSTIRS